jgi:hypothetical protein
MPAFIHPGDAEPFYFDDGREGFSVVDGEDISIPPTLSQIDELGEPICFDSEEIRRFFDDQRELFN